MKSKLLNNIILKWVIISAVLFALSDIMLFDPLNFYGSLFPEHAYSIDRPISDYFQYEMYRNIIHAIVLGLLLSIIFYFVEIRAKASIQQKKYKNQNGAGFLGAGAISALAIIIVGYTEHQLCKNLSGGAAAQCGIGLSSTIFNSVIFTSIITAAASLYSHIIYRKWQRSSAKKKKT